MPVRAFRAARAADIPYSVACAYLIQETSGGQNIFGHDGGSGGWYSGAGKVTKSKYLAYKRGRVAGRGMQGVGPMQLTYWSIQDEADRLGGCWKPYVNMLVGFKLIRQYKDSYGTWREAAVRYNGAESYGVEVEKRRHEWAAILKAGK